MRVNARSLIVTLVTVALGVALGYWLAAPGRDVGGDAGGVAGGSTEDVAQADGEVDPDGMTMEDGEEITPEAVQEACEREIVARSDLPFTEFPRPGTPEYSEPAYDEELEAWVWIVEVTYEEGMALRRQWECRVTAEGEGLLRRNY